MSDANYFDFTLPTKVEFGPGKIGILPEELARSDFDKTAIVTDRGIKGVGILDGPLSVLEQGGSRWRYSPGRRCSMEE